MPNSKSFTEQKMVFYYRIHIVAPRKTDRVTSLLIVVRHILRW